MHRRRIPVISFSLYNGMKIMRRTSIILIFIIALCCSPLLCSLAFGEAAWTFVVIGDTRGEPDTTTGVSEYLPAIASKITSLNPSLVLVSGDLVNGDALDNTPDVNNPRIPYTTQFSNWKTVMKPVYDAGITIYPVRGNHENYASDHDPTIPGLKQAYYNAFGSTVPQNGPNNGPDDNQVGFSWALKQKNVRIVTVDQYFYFQQTPVGGRNYLEIDQAWVDAQLAKTAPRRYTLVVAHEPVFSLDTEEGGFYGTSAQGMADRETFWNSLGANGSKMYLTAHVHNLQVGTAVDNSGNVIYQNMTGNGGAHMNPVSGERDPLLTPTYSNDKDYGFSLYTVTDNNITVTYYLYNPHSLTWSIAAYTITLLANPVYTWNVPLGTFSTASSWDPGTVPGAADTAVFDSGPGTLSTVNFTADAHNKRLFVASGPVTFNLAGKTYTADSTAIDGSEDASYRPSLTISGAGSRFNTTSLTMDGVSSFMVGAGASATCNTITIEGGTATIGGDITATTLDLGANTLTVVGGYTQAAGTTLKLTANSSSDFGRITSSAAAVVNAGSAVNVTVDGYIPNNATLTILSTGGLGIGNVPGTITSSNQYVTFLGSSLDGNLVLTADRAATGFEHAATNSNSAAVGAVLDNITSPSADMTTVLDALDNLSPSQVASTENTLTPNADGSITATSFSALNEFVGTVVDHLENVMLASSGGHGGQTGISAGSDPQENGVWAQGFGAYAHQGSRGLSNGYNGRLWGTAVGYDRLILNDNFRGGVSGGYSESRIQSKDFGGRTNIATYQTNLYGGYQNLSHPYYLESALSFASNEYHGFRYTFDRIANSSFNGQQYGFYFGGGYTYKVGKFDITPNASLRYMRLHLDSYDEIDAGALNLHVDSQNFDLLQPGIGVKLARAFEGKWGKFTPEFHIKYFYDTMSDKQDMVSNFAGGGGAFATQGYRPAQSSYNAGVRFTLLTKKNISLGLNYNFDGKQDYYSHTGLLEARYNF